MCPVITRVCFEHAHESVNKLYVYHIHILVVFTVLVAYRYSAAPLQRGQLSPRSSQNTSHSSPVRARYWMHIVSINRDFSSISDTAVMYSISCYIEQRYKALDCILISAMGDGEEIVLLLYARPKCWFLTSCFLCVGLHTKCPVAVKRGGSHR